MNNIKIKPAIKYNNKLTSQDFGGGIVRTLPEYKLIIDKANEVTNSYIQKGYEYKKSEILVSVGYALNNSDNVEPELILTITLDKDNKTENIVLSCRLKSKLNPREVTSDEIKISGNELEESKLTEDIEDDEIKLYMNTWKNYNEYGADLTLYGNIDGWMSLEDAKQFAEEHNEDEPFINDTQNCPWEIDENDNIEETIYQLERYEECINQEALKAIIEANGEDINEAFEIFDRGDFVFFKGVDNDADLAHAYIDMCGGLDNTGIEMSRYIDEEEYKESWKELAEETVRESNPELDENSNEYEILVDEMLNNISEAQLQVAIMDNNPDLENYFDYEAYGNDLSYSYFYASNGAVSILG